MKNNLIVLIATSVLLISLSTEAESIDKAGSVRAVPHKITRISAKPVLKKSLHRVTEASVVIPKAKLTASPLPTKRATIRPTPILIKGNSIRRACLTGDLKMEEALEIFNEYFDDSDYKRNHEISGIRIARDRGTRENVYRIDLCPMVRYNDIDGMELEATFFVDMTGEIFITERQID